MARMNIRYRCSHIGDDRNYGNDDGLARMNNGDNDDHSDDNDDVAVHYNIVRLNNS